VRVVGSVNVGFHVIECRSHLCSMGSETIFAPTRQLHCLQTLSGPRFRSCSADAINVPSSLARLGGPAGLPHQAKPAALNLHHCNLYQDILGWQDPFYRCCIAMFRRTNHAQRGLAAWALNHLDFSPCDHLAANKAIPFLIDRVPLPKLIESSQDI
jgi:hypothetical protein